MLHADAYHRHSEDYRIPGRAEHPHADDHHDDGHGHSHDHDTSAEHDHGYGTVESSHIRTRGGALGISATGARGFIGASVSRHESRYGVPGHSHPHDHDHPSGHGLIHGIASALPGSMHGHDHDHSHDHDVHIDMAQTRADLKARLDEPLPGHESVRLRMAHTDYRHFEIEDAIPATRFDNHGTEGRLELVHRPWAGWRGAYGLQYGRRDFSAVGAEAFVPPNSGSELGLFLIERRQWQQLGLELGLRHDRHRIDPQGDLPGRRFNAFSASVASQWQLDQRWHLRLGLDRAQRTPAAEELYSDGMHLATGGYEIGDAGLDRETANQIELALHYHGPALEMRAALFNNRFDDFIYLAATGEHDHGLPVRQWQQHDARFRGAEAELRFALADNASGRWQLRLQADRVRGQLRGSGDHLPRIMPDRYGAGIAWSHGGWRGDLSAMRYRSQNQVAERESATPGYTMLDADLVHALDVGISGEVEIFLQGRNLADRQARVHTSFLKDKAPLPGRSLGFGIRTFF